MKESDISYIAGLFDGEGSIHYKQAPEKKKRHKGKPGYRMSKLLAYQYGSNDDRPYGY